MTRLGGRWCNRWANPFRPGHMRINLPAAGLALAVVGLLAAGCAGNVAGVAATGPAVSSGSSTAASTTSVSYDTAPGATLIRVSRVSATIAGIQGSSGITLYGDGRMVFVGAKNSTQRRISPASVAELMTRAAALRGAADPGSPVTDVGWTDVEIHLGAETVTFRMGDVPGGKQTDQSSPEGKSRVAIGALLTRLASVDGVPVSAPPQSSGPAATGPSEAPPAPPSSGNVIEQQTQPGRVSSPQGGFVITADGRYLTTVPGASSLPRTLPDGATRRLITAASELNLLQARDFGTPILDAPTMTVTIRWAGGSVNHLVWSPDRADSSLTDKQRQARADVRSLIAAVAKETR